MKTLHTHNEEMESRFIGNFPMTKWDTFGRNLKDKMFTDFIALQNKQLYIKIAEGEIARLTEQLGDNSPQDSYELGFLDEIHSSRDYWNNILQELNK